jgi:hypothetical protein
MCENSMQKTEMKKNPFAQGTRKEEGTHIAQAP